MFILDTFDTRVRDDTLGLKDYFTMNNRVHKLSISSASAGNRYNLALENLRDPRTYAGIYLKPGTYRFTIKGVFPGTKWKDTCLSEIQFLEAGKPGLEEWLDDPFFKAHLPQTAFP
jgi:hypothetical protein